MRTFLTHAVSSMSAAVLLCLLFCSVAFAQSSLPENKALSKMDKQAECEKLLGTQTADPSKWSKSLILGFNLTDGNSNTLLGNLRAAISRDYESNIWNFAASGRYGEQEPKNADENGRRETETTAQDIKAEASYKRLFTDRIYAGTAVTYGYDKIADVDYRVILKPSLGYFIFRSDAFKLSAEAGPGYLFEEVGEVENNYFAPFVGERIEWTISETAKLFQTAEYLYDSEDSDNYLVTAEAGVEAALNGWLSLVVAVTDVYDNVPAEGKERNDLAVSTGLKVSL